MLVIKVKVAVSIMSLQFQCLFVRFCENSVALFIYDPCAHLECDIINYEWILITDGFVGESVEGFINSFVLIVRGGSLSFKLQ